MSSEPTTGPVPRLQTGSTAVPGVSRSARDAPDRRRGLPFTPSGVIAIVLLLIAVVGMLVAGESGRMRAAGNALVIAAAFAILVIAIVVASIPRILRDRALRHRFPDALVVTVGHGVRTSTRSLVLEDGVVSVWAHARDDRPETSWARGAVTRAIAVPSRRSIQRTADLVLVVDGRDEVFRPFRSATSFAQRMDRSAVETLAMTVPTA
jgi:hypothetical protein